MSRMSGRYDIESGVAQRWMLVRTRETRASLIKPLHATRKRRARIWCGQDQ
jgi:hypothetical protein